MSDIVNQSSFNAGEWSPNLNARVDLQKYHSGAALLENFFVDYRGGASSRPGSKYVIQAYKSATAVRLISFQASFNVGYELEFGDHYIRFIYQGAPVLENSFAVSAASQANPCVITVTGNNFATGDWIYIAAVAGMTQLNGRYFSVANVSGASITLADLNGVNINSTGYSAYTSGGTAARIYTLVSPWAAADLALLKFASSVNQMFLCHPTYSAYLLTIVSAANWTLNTATLGSTALAPTGVTASTTLLTGTASYSYVVTSIDAAGQESSASVPANIINKTDIRSVAGSNSVTWTLNPNAVRYYIYRADVTYFGVIPQGIQYGYIGWCSNNTFVDSNINPDFSMTPPVSGDPFSGSGINAVAVTAAGTYTTTPTVTTSGGSPSIPATLLAELQVQGTPTVTSGGTNYAVGDVINFGFGVALTVLTLSGSAVATWAVTAAGSITAGATPHNAVSQVSTSGTGNGASATITWGVGVVIILAGGAGYASTPTIVFSGGSATATATLGPTSNGNPSVPGFVQQRLAFMAPSGAPQTIFLSQPGLYLNFDTHVPLQADDAIEQTLVSGVLSTIKSMVASSAGALILSDKVVWLVTGGTSGSAISATAIAANPQSYIGANDVPPITSNYDVLYVTAKGCSVRDLSYNVYFSIFTGTDISLLSSHLFYGFQILEWAWAEQPFYTAWAERNDGVLLSLTYLKEQDFIGWSHHVTSGNYTSVSSITEDVSGIGNVDAVYTVVERMVSGNAVKYIERFAERVFNTVSEAWCVDSGLQYVGAPQSSFQGAEHLAGLTCTGLADGVIIPNFVMPANGEFAIGTAASTVTVGLAYTCKLQTLAIDIGSPSIQGKVKKIPFVDVRVSETLGLSIGNDFNSLVPMKDLVVGNVSSMLTGQASQIVTDLVTGDARTILSPAYTVPGQYCIEQSNPFPASILGVFPSIVVGDDSGAR